MPDGFNPVEQVLAGIAATPWRHEVVLRIHGAAEHVLAAFPARIVTVEPTDTEDGWVRVRIRAERLDWVPALLAHLSVPFIIDGPDALREAVRDLGARLTGRRDLITRTPVR